MNRLTDRNKEIPLPCTGNGVFWARVHEKLARYEDSGLEPEEVDACKLALIGKSLAEVKEIEGISVERMKELAKAEAEGRLLVLPCKVGDVVYYHFQFKNKRILPFTRKAKVKRIYCKRNSFDVDVELMDAKESGIMKTFHADDFGKTVFLTREAAEKALEGMGNDER